MKVDTPLADRTPRQDRPLLAGQRQNSEALALAAEASNPGVGGKRPAETLVGAGAFQTRSRQMLDGHWARDLHRLK
jgi:hypothetical protein